jgi:hypothetical protein
MPLYRSGVRALLMALPAAVLLASLGTVSWHTGSWWPWTRVVHEDGKRTLLGTIFFFEHAARELPLDLILACAVVASARCFYPRPATDGRTLSRHVRVLPAAGALVTMAVILIGAAMTAGPYGLLNNLLQMHTRPGAALEWGAHWRYHLLERLAGMLLAFAACGLHRRLLDQGTSGLGQASTRPFAMVLAVFAVASLFFGVNAKPFTDAVYLGHQARELFTHGLVTVPLALGACLGLVAASKTPAGSEVEAATPRMGSVYLAGTAAIVIGAYLAVGTLATGASSQAQTTDLVAVVFVHFFEHTLTYVLVPLTVMALCPGGADPR